MLDHRPLLPTDLVSVGEGAEEQSDLVQDVVVVGGEDEVGHVAAGGPGLQVEAVPEVETERRHGQPLPLVADHEAGDGQRLAPVVRVALGGDARHAVELAPGQRPLHRQLRALRPVPDVEAGVQHRQQNLR